MYENYYYPSSEDGFTAYQRGLVKSLDTICDSPMYEKKEWYRTSIWLWEALIRDPALNANQLYEEATQMVQPFLTLYPLVKGKGNWGSIDGDSAAWPHHTKASPTVLGNYYMLNTRRANMENVLPHVLINGFAPNGVLQIPPHDIVSVVEACLAYLESPDRAPMEDILKAGLPTGADILEADGIIQFYRTGRGSFRSKARGVIEGNTFILTHMPFGVDKSSAIQAIVDWNKSYQALTNIVEESSYEDVRVVFTFKSGSLERLEEMLHYAGLVQTHSLLLKTTMPYVGEAVTSLRRFLDTFYSGRKDAYDELKQVQKTLLPAVLKEQDELGKTCKERMFA